MKYKIKDNVSNCVFEEYDNFNKELKLCQIESNIYVGNKCVCCEHLSNVMLSDKQPEMEDCRNGNLTIIEFVPDFLKITKGLEVTAKQQFFEF